MQSIEIPLGETILVIEAPEGVTLRVSMKNLNRRVKQETPKRLYGITTAGSRTVIAKTCATCGELKMASEFRKKSKAKPYIRSTCNVCLYKEAKKARKSVNDLSITTARNKSKKWTQDELDELAKLVEEGNNYREIANKLGRTYASVQQAYYKIK